MLTKAESATLLFENQDPNATVEAKRLRKYQSKHAVWQRDCLPENANTSLEVLALGLTEEICKELVEAYRAEDSDLVFDALGDALIYTMAICSKLNFDFATVSDCFDDAAVEDLGPTCLENMSLAVGKLTYVVGKRAQHTRGFADDSFFREQICEALANVCHNIHRWAYGIWVVEDILDATLQDVTKRNWRVNANAGASEG